MARLLVLATMTVGGMLCGSAPAHPLQADRSATAVALAKLSVPFVPNAGQWDPAAAFGARTLGGTLFVTGKGELVYSLPGLPVAAVGCESPAVRQAAMALPRCMAARRGPGWVFTETLVDGSRAPRRVTPHGDRQNDATVSYFIGDDALHHASAIKSYDRLSLGEVYPGIDLQLRATQNNVEKIFAVSPHHDPGQIRLRLAGIDAAELGADGELIVHTGNGPVSFTAPVAYQEDAAGVRTTILAAYRLDAAQHSYGFTVGSYDRTRALIIDPLLNATYLGAAGDDEINAAAIHPVTGDVYVAGYTSSTGSTFPGVAGGARPGFGGGSYDAFVSRFSGDLSTLRGSTYLGAGAVDVGTALAIHPGNLDIYVAGFTTSPGSTFPGTAGGYQPSNGGSFDVFIARLTPDLATLVRSTYLGAAGDDSPTALIANPANGDIYVTGFTTSPSSSFPGSAGGAQSTYSGGGFDAFVSRLDGSLQSLVNSTYLGGSGTENALALAAHPVTGAIYVTGYTDGAIPGTATGAQPANGGTADAFITRLNPNLANIVRSTFFGAAGSTAGYAIAIHPMTGDVYIAGFTTSPGTTLPGTAGGAQPAYGGGSSDAYVAQFDASLKTIKQATYLGSASNDNVASKIALAIHPVTGDIYVAGATDAGGSTFPGVAGGSQASNGGFNDAYISRLSADLTSLIQSTYYGAGGTDFAQAALVDPFSGDVLIAGVTASTGLPLPGTSGGAQNTYAGGGDGFVARFTLDLRSISQQPSALTFTPRLNVAPGTVQFSNPAPVSGIAGPAPISIAGGAFARYCISSVLNCALCNPYVSAAGTIDNGLYVCLKQQAPLAVPGVSETAILVGTTIGTFMVATGTALNLCSLDVDGNGAVDALTDGLIVLRAMFGLTGTSVINGAVGIGAPRNTWALIRAYLNGNCGTNFAP